MKIITSRIFKQFSELSFGFSTKIGLNRKSPFNFNMSFTVGDNNIDVEENRKAFFSELGLNVNNVCYQKQTHNDIIQVVNDGGFTGESDGMITGKNNLGLAISSADCTEIFLYDKINRVIAAVHSGWRGTEQKILEKTIGKLFTDFNSKPENIFVFLAPSISQSNYEVGKEVADLFVNKYLVEKESKFYLDVAGNNYDMLIEADIPKVNIEKSELCSFKNDYLHSYRRDGKVSGRAFGVIAMKDTE